ncbi:MAG: ATP-dependent helicase [Acidobacteria bacterium]|nr:ATP-dependent helicase [Acidobacteriota bacterium]
MDTLNQHQRQAVEHLDGPLLIVAGAGTGKTRVIVERVGHLLANVPGLRPQNILALTFSRKAAEEMRERAVSQFGERVRDCRFSTFHAFCYELLEQHQPRRVLDKFDQWIFLRRHLDALQLEHYFRAAEPGRFLDDLVEFCSRCHDNLVSPEDYGAFVEQLLRDCQDPVRRQALLEQCAEAELARQQEVARVYARSEALQEQEGFLNFGAMISRAVALLDSLPRLLARLQKQYRFISVDEFQDTNAAQFELLARLAGKHRNLAVVGDDDQAIYRFRGASYGSFDLFNKHFPDRTCLVLNHNYRSTQKILAVAGAAIAFNLKDRYQPDKQLVTSNPPGCAVAVWEFAEEAEQAEYAAAEIARRVRTGEAKAYSHFGVLYRAHRHRDLLVAALRRHGVPFAIRGLAVNHLPPVRDGIACLRFLGRPGDNVSLARAVADPRWGLEPPLFFDYCRRAKEKERTLFEVIQEDSAPPDWPARARLLAFHSRFSQIAKQQRLSAWFELLRGEMGFYGSRQENAALQAFADFLRQWDEEKSATGLLSEFLEYFDYFEEAGGTVNLPEDDAIPRRQREPHPPQSTLWEDGPADPLGRVQLTTVHGAKGLEFEHVIVLQLLNKAFPTIRRSTLIPLPAPLWKGPLPEGDFHQEEERRLFYVALTRARSTLALCTISNDRQRPSVFLENLRQSPDIEWKRPSPAPEEMNETAAASAPGPSQPSWRGSLIGHWAAASRPLPPKDLVLSASGLDTYLKCPLKYLYTHLWRIPSPLSPPLLFGSILHGAVRDLVHTIAHRPETVSPEGIERLLDEHWTSSAFSDPVQEKKYRAIGAQQLEGLWRLWAQRRFELLHQEKTFLFEWTGVRLRGRFDQIHRLDGEEAELTEYKTGTPQTQKDADKSLQLTIYARACRESLGLDRVRLVLFNLTTQQELRTSRSKKDFQEAEEKIREAAARIRSGEFPPQRGYQCRRCDFRLICPAQEESALDSLGGSTV